MIYYRSKEEGEKWEGYDLKKKKEGGEGYDLENGRRIWSGERKKKKKKKKDRRIVLIAKTQVLVPRGYFLPH